MIGTADTSAYRFTFQISEFVGEARSNDRRWLTEFRQVYYRPAAEGATPRACYEIFVDRRLSTARRHLVKDGKRYLLLTSYYPSILPTLEWHISQSLAAALPSCSFLRAAALVYRGRSFLILGGDALQNRICKVFVDRGAALYADELAIVRRADRRLVHHPKSIGLKRPRHGLVSRQKKHASFRGGDKMVTTYLRPSPIPPEISDREIEILLFLEPDCGGGKARVTPISQGEALARLCQHTWGAPPASEEQFTAMSDLAGSCRVLKLAPAGLKRTVDFLVDTVV